MAWGRLERWHGEGRGPLPLEANLGLLLGGTLHPRSGGTCSSPPDSVTGILLLCEGQDMGEHAESSFYLAILGPD